MRIKRFRSSKQRIGTLASQDKNQNQNQNHNITKYVYNKDNHKNIIPPTVSEAGRRIKVTPATGVNVKKRANERVRTKVRRVQQSAQLGGYWSFANGKQFFVSTVGRRASASKRKKPNQAPTPNQTTNVAPRKPKEKLVKRPKKKKVPEKIQRIMGRGR